MDAGYRSIPAGEEDAGTAGVGRGEKDVSKCGKEVLVEEELGGLKTKEERRESFLFDRLMLEYFRVLRMEVVDSN